MVLQQDGKQRQEEVWGQMAWCMQNSKGPVSDKVEGEDKHLRLSSDFHMWAVAGTYLHIFYTHTQSELGKQRIKVKVILEASLGYK